MAGGPGSGDCQLPPNQQELLDALEARDAERFRLALCAPGVRVDYRYEEDRNRVGTCLEIACRWQGTGELVRLLLEHVDPNVNHIRMEPIHHAARHANVDALRQLLADRRTRIFARDVSGRTALHQAFLHVKPERLRAHLKCVDLLMDKFRRSALNGVDNYGCTAVHLAVLGDGAVKRDAPNMSKDEVDARRRLVEKILEQGQATIDLDTARSRLGSSAREDILRTFPDLKAKLPDRSARRDPHQALVDAMMVGDINLFQQLLRRTRPDGGPVFDPGHWFGAPMHASCLELACGREGAAPFVAALLEAGADPNVANALTGTYPVHEACKQGLGGNLQALLDNGKTEVNPNCADKLGNTALHYAVEINRGYEDVQKSVILEGGQVNLTEEGQGSGQVNNRNNQLLANKLKCLQMLLELNDINIHVRNGNGRKPIDVAKDCRNEDAKKKLDEALKRETADRNTQPTDAEKLIYYLKQKRLTQFKKLLKTAKGKQDTFTEEIPEFGTLLQYAARYGPKQAVSCLLEAGANPNATCSTNRSPPLVLAAQYGRADILKKFLKPRWGKLDVNARDQKGNTALHYKTKEECLESVILLLSYCADPRQTNNLGKYALDETQAEAFLDRCVRSNNKPPLDEDYEIVFDYSLLVAVSKNSPFRPAYELREVVCCGGKGRKGPESIPLQPVNPPHGGQGRGFATYQQQVRRAPQFQRQVQGEMELLKTFCGYEKKGLLEHPVARSFHSLKWEKMRTIAYSNLIIYFFFVVCLNIFIMSHVGNNVDVYVIGPSTESNSTRQQIGESDVSWRTIAMPCLLITFASYIVIREIVQMYVDTKRYFENYENYLDLLLPICTFWSIASPSCWLDVVTIMASCFELLLMISRVSNFAKYVHMLQVVLKTYVFISVPYATILLAFALSFHRVFANYTGFGENNEEPNLFRTFPMSIVKVIVMMSGELEAGDIPLEDTVLGVLLFVAFVALVTIVLLNLLIALAVSDTQTIKKDADMLWLQNRVRVLVDIESIMVKFATIFPHVPCFKSVLLFPQDQGDEQKTQAKEGWVRPNGAATLNIRTGSGSDSQSGEVKKGKRRKVKQKIMDRARKILSKRQSLQEESPEERMAEKMDRILALVSKQSDARSESPTPPGSPVAAWVGDVPAATGQSTA